MVKQKRLCHNLVFAATNACRFMLSDSLANFALVTMDSILGPDGGSNVIDEFINSICKSNFTPKI